MLLLGLQKVLKMYTRTAAYCVQKMRQEIYSERHLMTLTVLSHRRTHTHTFNVLLLTYGLRPFFAGTGPEQTGAEDLLGCGHQPVIAAVKRCRQAICGR